MNSFDILRRPIISERSMETVLDREGNEIKRYTFEVPKTVNKVEIKKAVEEAFGVKVAKVNTMNVLGKVTFNPPTPTIHTATKRTILIR